MFWDNKQKLLKETILHTGYFLAALTKINSGALDETAFIPLVCVASDYNTCIHSVTQKTPSLVSLLCTDIMVDFARSAQGIQQGVQHI